VGGSDGVVVGGSDGVVVGGSDAVVDMVGATVIGRAVLTMGGAVVGFCDFGVVSSNVGGVVTVVGLSIDGASDEGKLLGIGVIVLGDSDILVRMDGATETRASVVGATETRAAVGATVVDGSAVPTIEGATVVDGAVPTIDAAAVGMTVVSVEGSGVGVVMLLEEAVGEVLGFCVGITVCFAFCSIVGAVMAEKELIIETFAVVGPRMIIGAGASVDHRGEDVGLVIPPLEPDCAKN